MDDAAASRRAQRGQQPRREGLLPRTVRASPGAHAATGPEKGGEKGAVGKRGGSPGPPAGQGGPGGGRWPRPPGCSGSWDSGSHRESDVATALGEGLWLLSRRDRAQPRTRGQRRRDREQLRSRGGRTGQRAGHRAGKDLQQAGPPRRAAPRRSGPQGGAQTSLSSPWAPLPAGRAGARVADMIQQSARTPCWPSSRSAAAAATGGVDCLSRQGQREPACGLANPRLAAERQPQESPGAAPGRQ